MRVTDIWANAAYTTFNFGEDEKKSLKEQIENVLAPTWLMAAFVMKSNTSLNEDVFDFTSILRKKLVFSLNGNDFIELIYTHSVFEKKISSNEIPGVLNSIFSTIENDYVSLEEFYSYFKFLQPVVFPIFKLKNIIETAPSFWPNGFVELLPLIPENSEKYFALANGDFRSQGSYLNWVPQDGQIAIFNPVFIYEPVVETIIQQILAIFKKASENCVTSEETRKIESTLIISLDSWNKKTTKLIEEIGLTRSVSICTLHPTDEMFTQQTIYVLTLTNEKCESRIDATSLKKLYK